MAARTGQSKAGGRKKGTPNKAKVGLKAAFQKHETELVAAIMVLTKSGDSMVRLAALKVALDRGYGRPEAPPVQGHLTGDFTVRWAEK